MEGRCTECGTNTVLHHYLTHLCYNCYEDMFKTPMPNPFEEEPDFVLKNDVATITPKGTTIKVGNSTMYISDKDLVFATLKFPKKMVFNPDARAKDYEKLIEFILHNMHITDEAPGFEKVSWMFKEVE
jgi:hypothetical protein